jgi:hypothetical protein
VNGAAHVKHGESGIGGSLDGRRSLIRSGIPGRQPRGEDMSAPTDKAYAPPLPSHKYMCAECVSKTITIPASGAHDRPGGDCFAILNHTEVCDLDYRAVVAGELNAGDTDTYTCELLDAEDENVIARNVGVSWKTHNRTSDGHLLSYYRERFTFDDGIVETAGWIDIDAIEGGAWQSLHAVGITGAYHGKVGVRELWQEIKRRQFRNNIILCGKPEL